MTTSLVGQTFGRWTVIADAERRGYAQYFPCRCSCGTERVVFRANLLNGMSRSCGCLRVDVSSQLTRTHGMSRTREHQSWQDAKKRCFNPRSTGFQHYGARGITMCERWRGSFEVFLSDMGPCPNGFTLDRINVHGNYEPTNCRWASRKTQANNQTRNHVITYKGVTKNLSEWAESLGIRMHALLHRIDRDWPIDEAMTTRALTDSTRRNNRYLTYKGHTACVMDWSRKSGVPVGTLLARLRNGWSVARALTDPVRPMRRDYTPPLEHNGQTLTVAEWARVTGFPVGAIRARLTMGWSVKRALTQPIQPRRSATLAAHD